MYYVVFLNGIAVTKGERAGNSTNIGDVFLDKSRKTIFKYPF